MALTAKTPGDHSESSEESSEDDMPSDKHTSEAVDSPDDKIV